MERKKEHSSCPKCGFDYSQLKPTFTLVQCPQCGGSFADVSENYIRIIIHDNEELQNEIAIKLDDMDAFSP